MYVTFLEGCRRHKYKQGICPLHGIIVGITTLFLGGLESLPDRVAHGLRWILHSNDRQLNITRQGLTAGG